MIKIYGRSPDIKGYGSARTFLAGRRKRKIVNNTYLEERDGETIALRFHYTGVVTYKSDGRVILKTGGWKTVTTKERLNAFSPVGVYQRRGVWYVSYYTGGGYHRPLGTFYEGMTVDNDGMVYKDVA